MTDDERNERAWDLIAAEIARCAEEDDAFDPARIGMVLVERAGETYLLFPEQVEDEAAYRGIL